jgi:hypothetical protein
MKRPLSLFLLGMVLFSGASALHAQVTIDYDHTANFPTYKTYSWMKVRSGDSLWDDRIKQDVDGNWLQKDGRRSIPAVMQHQRISQHAGSETLETFYNGFGWRGMGGTGMLTTTTDVTKVGDVVVDIFDAHSQKPTFAPADRNRAPRTLCAHDNQV